MAIVVHRDNGSYQIHLMTYSAKGSPRRDLCIYLTHEEYEALENYIPDINHAIELITLSTSSKKTHYYYAVTSGKLFLTREP